MAKAIFSADFNTAQGFSQARDWRYRLVLAVILGVALPELGGLARYYPASTSVYCLTCLFTALSLYLEFSALIYLAARLHDKHRGDPSASLLAFISVFAFLAWLATSTLLRYLLWCWVLDIPVNWPDIERACLILLTAAMITAQIYLGMFTKTETMQAEVIRKSFRNEESIALSASQAYRQAPESILGALRALCRLIASDPDSALRCARDLASVHRYILGGAWRDLVPLRDELDLLMCHARLLEVRFGVLLNLDVAFGKNSPNHYLIVPVSLHQILENALLFGHLNASSAAAKTIKIDLESQQIRLSYPWTFQRPTAEEADHLEALHVRVAAITGMRPRVDRAATHFSVSLPILSISG